MRPLSPFFTSQTLSHWPLQATTAPDNRYFAPKTAPSLYYFDSGREYSLPDATLMHQLDRDSSIVRRRATGSEPF